MSWEVDIGKKTEKGIEYIYEVGNYTWNVGRMYTEAMGCSISDFKNMPCSKAILILQVGIKDMEKNPEKYKELNPPNKWGNYEYALQYLKDILHACQIYKENPDCIIQVN